jgi:hypothetical protein
VFFDFAGCLAGRFWLAGWRATFRPDLFGQDKLVIGSDAQPVVFTFMLNNQLAQLVKKLFAGYSLIGNGY